MPMKPRHRQQLNDLLLTRSLLTPQGAWTQGAPARNAAGKAVSPLSEDAVSWSAYGAAWRAVRPTTPTDIRLRRVLREMVPHRLNNAVFEDATRAHEWNDAPDRQQVHLLDGLDSGIKVFTDIEAYEARRDASPETP